jgi:hypothetical protein
VHPQALNLLIVALTASIIAVGWVGVLASILIYMFGCMATIAIGKDPNLVAALPNVTSTHFGTVQRSMLTLVQIMTLDSWTRLAREYMSHSTLVTMFVLVYMIFAALILMNLMAAIFVDKLMRLSDEEKVKEEEAKEAKKQEFAAKLKNVFLAFDDDGNGALTAEELKALPLPLPPAPPLLLSLLLMVNGMIPTPHPTE